LDEYGLSINMLLLTSDLHLTSRPIDEYRWGIFKLLRQCATKYDVTDILILGDLTQNKDKHDSRLVNRLVDALTKLAVHAPVYVLMGNHDYVSEQCPFFRFLRHIPRLCYLTRPEATTLGKLQVFFFPHQLEFESVVKQSINDLKRADLIVLHQTMAGAIGENGIYLHGSSAKMLPRSKIIISGDVHVPQHLSQVLYCGAPYHVHFGDSYTPRVLLVSDTKRVRSLKISRFPRRWSVKIKMLKELQRLDVSEGDQLKCTIQIIPSTLTSWQDLKRKVEQWCIKKKIDLVGTHLDTSGLQQAITASVGPAVLASTPVEILRRYAKLKRLDDRTLNYAINLLDTDHG